MGQTIFADHPAIRLECSLFEG